MNFFVGVVKKEKFILMASIGYGAFILMALSPFYIIIDSLKRFQRVASTAMLLLTWQSLDINGIKIFVVILMDFQSKKLEYIIKSGAIVSTLGVGMLILFGSVLLIFPVVKLCEKSCVFVSTAPQYLGQIIKPLFLVISLTLISLGVFLIRIGKWKHQV